MTLATTQLMPKRCVAPGCSEIGVFNGAYCPGHTKERSRQKDRLPTNDPRWIHFRNMLKGLGNVLCQVMIDDGTRCKNATWGYHHILPAADYPSLALEPANVVGVCLECHNRVEASPERAMYVPTLWRMPMSNDPLPRWMVAPGDKARPGVMLWTRANRLSLLTTG